MIIDLLDEPRVRIVVAWLAVLDRVDNRRVTGC